MSESNSLIFVFVLIYLRLRSAVKVLFGGILASAALTTSALAFAFCDNQDPGGEISWDVQDNGTAIIPFTLSAGDASTSVKNVASASISGLHQFAGDLAASLLSPSGTEVILFRLGNGRYSSGIPSSCSSADFDLTFSDNAPGTDLSVFNEFNYCTGTRDRSIEAVHPQPYLPFFLQSAVARDYKGIPRPTNPKA